MLRRMPGDTWQQFANLRAYYSFMWTHPGKKLLFMGCEFGQVNEWNHDQSLDWHLTDDEWHQGIQRLIKDLNQVYKDYSQLHQLDCSSDGFEWIDGGNTEQSIISYCRYGYDKEKPLVVICNFTPNTHEDFQLGMPVGGQWREIINSDAQQYQGSNMVNQGLMDTFEQPSHGCEHSIRLRVPPLATVILELVS